MGTVNGLKNLASELSSDEHHQPVHNLEVGIYYQYLTAEEDMFSKSFVFMVIEDTDDYYMINIEKQYETPLAKTFELVEAINTGKIIRLGIL